ncbi:ABC transporter permease subunit [Aerococcaceae bacterium DSM 109652]|uniref:ABC transporter permease subunit n=1 Tax=Fundicoccus ignavus TaxID=2664442 RepID=A0A844C9S4_9LACT|nr:ABC transporter permease subunit [Fundicoccus ignavus]
MGQIRRTKVIIYIGLLLFSIYFIGPFLWIILTAFKDSTEVNTFPPKILPSVWRWSNFSDAWNSQPFNQYLWNSILVTVLTTVGQVISSSLVAYGFARYDFKFKNFLFMVLLASMMLPWDVTMIPQYMLFNELGWINTLLPLIVPGMLGSAYYIFLLRQFLMNFPDDIANAAKIDGANDFQIYSRVFLPIMKAPLILVAILNVLTVWNDYLGPLIFLQNRSKYTLALGLASFQGVHDNNIIGIMAITILMMIPPILLFLFAQKYIIDGLEGSIK